MLKKTRRQMLTIGLAGVLSAGSLFSGVALSTVFAQEEQAVSEAEEMAEVQEEQTEAAEVDNAVAEESNDSVDEETASEENDDIKEESKKEIRQTEDNPPEESDNKESGSEAVQADEEEKQEDNVKAEVENNESELTFTIKNNSGKDIIGARVSVYKANESDINAIIRERSQFEGQDLVDNIVQGDLKESGSAVDTWITTEAGHSKSLEPGFYVLFTNIIWSNNLYIKVSDSGDIQTGYYDYDSKSIRWNSIDNNVINYSYSAFDNYESSVNPKIRVRDARFKGGSIDSAKVSLYKKTSSELQEVTGKRNSRGEYEFSIDYPADYVIKNTDIEEGYKKFDDIEFSVIRNSQTGLAEFVLADNSREDIDLISYYDETMIYEEPIYGPQEICEAYFDIIVDYANYATFPVTVNTDLSELSKLEWALKDSSVLENMDIKLYKYDYSGYRNIIEENGGMMGATQGAIWETLKGRAQLVEKWSADETKHSINVAPGDYYISVNDTLFGLNEPVIYFNVSEGTGEIAEYVLEPGGWGEDDVVSKNYLGSNENLSIKIDDMVLWAKYVDPVVMIKSQDGASLTEGTEIEIYRKDGDTLTRIDRTARNQAGIYYEYDSDIGAYINTLLEHPGTYIIRCIKVPDGYAPFSDITVKIDTDENGYPQIEIIDSNGNNLKIRGFYNPEGSARYYHRDVDPAVIEIVLKKSSSAVGSSAGVAAGNSASAQAVNASGTANAGSSGQVSAANTGDRNFTAVYFAVAAAAAIAGVVTFAVKKKRED